MSTSGPVIALSGIPKGLRDPLFQTFNSIMRNFREAKWEPAELNGGKLCEVVYTILSGHVEGRFPPKPKKPKNMVDACKAFESANQTTFSRSIRVQLPRMLIALYEIRNNRGVGHVGGDVDPNHMDAVMVVSAAKWIMAELVRIFHGVDTAAATGIVDGLTDRTIPLVWKVSGKRRVLNPRLGMKEKMLVLLYESLEPVKESDLVDWIEHSNPAVFRRDVLVKAHKAKLIEYSRKAGTVQISPSGIREVEQKIPLEL